MDTHEALLSSVLAIIHLLLSMEVYKNINNGEEVWWPLMGVMWYEVQVLIRLSEIFSGFKKNSWQSTMWD